MVFRLDRPPQIWVGRFSGQNLRQIEILEQPAGGLHSPPQVPPVHISDAAFEEGEQLAQTLQDLKSSATSAPELQAIKPGIVLDFYQPAATDAATVVAVMLGFSSDRRPSAVRIA